MFSSAQLKEIVAQVRPIIERQIDDALQIAAFRDVVSAEGGDWSALKALLKAQVQDERDESGDGKHVKKLLSKAEFASACADMLGLANMNEDNFSAGDDYDDETGEILSEVITPKASNSGALGAKTSDLSITPSQAVKTPAASEAGPRSGDIEDHQYEPLSVPSAAQEAPASGVGGSSGRTESSADGQTPVQVAEDMTVHPEAKDAPDPEQGVQILRPGPVSDEAAAATDTAADYLREPAAVVSGQIIREGDAPRESGRFGGDASGPDTDFNAAAETDKPAGEDDGAPAAPSFDMTDPDAPTPAQKHFILALRPFCQNLNACGAQGRNHCRSCKRAAEAAGKVAA